MGGLAFTLTTVWAMLYPFIALQFYDAADDAMRYSITIFLAASLVLWLYTNIIFFLAIDLNFISAFFGTKTAPQYTCELFLESEEDEAKFRAAFKNHSR